MTTVASQSEATVASEGPPVRTHNVHRVRHDPAVPRICEFYGIVIEMYFADHPPPHFHARYVSREATIVIATGEVLAGGLPGRALGSCENGSANIARSVTPTGSAPATTKRPNR